MPARTLQLAESIGANNFPKFADYFAEIAILISGSKKDGLSKRSRAASEFPELPASF
jgi:hypothetical protein